MSDIKKPDAKLDKIDAPLEGEVVTKKPRYAAGSRKGKGGVKSQNLEVFLKPMVVNFVCHCIRDGKSDSEIARLVNVPKTTFHRWKKSHTELWNEAVSNSDNPVKQVEDALLKRAKGFMIERPTYRKDGTLIGSKFQYYPPDMGAVQYFLNNRAPAEWKSKVEHNHAIEELPLSITFVNGSEKKKELPPLGDNKSDLAKAAEEMAQSLATMLDNEDQGKRNS
jgi:hypothetical protein